MTAREVFNKFNKKLLNALPMKDVVFLATLNSEGLFPGNLKDEVKEKSSSAEAADHFLWKTVEKDLLNGQDKSFRKLLDAMMDFGDSTKELAITIKKKIDYHVRGNLKKTKKVTG